jgi:AcrR family transcriptional regulator
MVQKHSFVPARQRLLSAAEELFYLHGINAVGIAAIAERAGLTKKTIYDCFRSKDEIVVAYLTERHRDWTTYLDARLAVDAPSPLAVFDSYIDHLSEGAEFNGCGFINAAAHLGFAHPAMAIVREHKAEVRRRIAELLPARLATPAEHEALVAHLFYLLEGAVVDTGIARALRPLAASRQIAETVIANYESGRRQTDTVPVDT